MERREIPIQARLQQLWQQLRQPFINQDGQEDGVCLRSDLSANEKQSIYTEQRTLRDQFLTLALANPTYRQIRVGYAVAGWSERHDYFRNKYNIFETLEEAKACLLRLKDDPQWGIPTVIVEMTFRLVNSPEPERFETEPVNQLGFAQTQKVVAKDKMGRRGPSWDLMLSCSGNGGVYTY
jgi:hypothetical protein